jgi:ubiquinone/menaquinone biosynthesis C-methylase UbiE
MVKKAVQQGRSERRGDGVPGGYVESLSDARTKLADFFNILRWEGTMICTQHSLILRELFERYGYEHQVTAKNYLMHGAYQDWQVSLLMRAGLKPHHDFLDIGCGWLRLGSALLPYLEEGRYHGIDNTETNLAMGREFLKRLGVGQQPILLHDEHFSFERFGKAFDFAMCHAVFTHLSHDQIEECFANLAPVMKPGGLGLFTFYLAGADKERPNHYRMADGRTLEYTSAYVTLSYFDRLFGRLGLRWKHLPNRQHPSGQEIIAVYFDGRPVSPTARPGAETVAQDDGRDESSPLESGDGKREARPLYRRILEQPAWHDAVDQAGLRRRLCEVGYVVIRGFCAEAETRDIRTFWHRYPMRFANKGYWIGRPDYALHRQPIRAASGQEEWPKDLKYECFFWNQPPHVTTYEVSWAANLLRNVVWGVPIHTHLLPLDGYATSYRPTRSDRGNVGMASHVDERLPGQPWLIQNSLVLSAMGTDYSGGGMWLTLKNGRRINVYETEALGPGDLLIWDQQLEHEVPPVTESDPDAPCSGAWRILMPTHPVVERPDLWRTGMTSHHTVSPIAPAVGVGEGGSR